MAEPEISPSDALQNFAGALEKLGQKMSGAAGKSVDAAAGEKTAELSTQLKAFSAQVMEAAATEKQREAEHLAQIAAREQRAKDRLAAAAAKAKASAAALTDAQAALEETKRKEIPNPSYGLAVRDNLLDRFAGGKPKPVIDPDYNRLTDWAQGETLAGQRPDPQAAIPPVEYKIAPSLGRTLGQKMELSLDRLPPSPLGEQSTQPGEADQNLDDLSWRDWLFRSSRL